MKNNKITMNDFCKFVGETEEEIKNGYLDLRGTGITQLPDNLTVGGNLYLHGTGITDTSKVKRTLSAEARRKIAAKQNMMVVLEWINRTYIKFMEYSLLLIAITETYGVCINLGIRNRHILLLTARTTTPTVTR